MEIEFHNLKLQKLCNSAKNMTGKWGPKMAKKLQQRLSELAAANTLENMRNMPGRCHELKGDRKWQLALDLVHPQRLIFAPNHDPMPIRPGGGLDWSGVNSIVILEILDYHD